MSMKSMAAQERKWEIESAGRTLEEAEKVKLDKKLYKAALADIRKRRKALSAVLTANPE